MSTIFSGTRELMSFGRPGGVRTRARLFANRCLGRLTKRPWSGKEPTSLAVRRVLEHYPSLSADEIVERLSYSTFVNFERRYMYFEVPKAGCTSMKALLHKIEKHPPLEQNGKYDRPSRQVGLLHNRQYFRMPSLLDFDDRKQELILDSPLFFRFTVVRNPYTRVASAWRDKIQVCAPDYLYLYERLHGRPPDAAADVITFREFLDFLASEDLDRCDAHWRRQTAHLLIKSVDFSWIGRLEEMSFTMEKFGRHLDLKLEMPSVGDRPGAAQYTEISKELVHRYYSDDFAIFGYDNDSWKKERVTQLTVPIERYLSDIIAANVKIAKLVRIREELLKGRG